MTVTSIQWRCGTSTVLGKCSISGRSRIRKRFPRECCHSHPQILVWVLARIRPRCRRTDPRGGRSHQPAAGSRTVNSLPCPIPTLAALTLPPCESTKLRTRVRPMPSRNRQLPTGLCAPARIRLVRRVAQRSSVIGRRMQRRDLLAEHVNNMSTRVAVLPATPPSLS